MWRAFFEAHLRTHRGRDKRQWAFHLEFLGLPVLDRLGFHWMQVLQLHQGRTLNGSHQD